VAVDDVGGVAGGVVGGVAVDDVGGVAGDVVDVCVPLPVVGDAL
jgi:outer membrane lipoprotein SlyB